MASNAITTTLLKLIDKDDIIVIGDLDYDAIYANEEDNTTHIY